MAIHQVEPDRETLHGAFSPETVPILTIEPGDTVVYRTLDAGWGLEPHTAPGQPRRKFTPRHSPADDGHALLGPVAVRGVEPGDMLAIEIEEIVPGGWGWCCAGGWHSRINDALGLSEAHEFLHIWTLDSSVGVGVNQHGHTVRLKPFMGVMGMPPNTPEFTSTTPPRLHGGNLDCKELTAGSTLYLPVAVPGGLFSVGDGHAVQGDGEVSGTAIECPMERVTLTFRLEEKPFVTTPYARTAEGWLTMGFDEDLNAAMLSALTAMLILMQNLYVLEKQDAVALASLTVDLRVTQVVNGVLGVHAVLPFGALQGVAERAR